MPTSKTTIHSLLANSTTEPKAFVTAFRTKLEAVGFTSTADTGQYDEATGISNNNVNQLMGHKIFRTPDSDPLHSVMPIFMKGRIRVLATLPTGGSYSMTVSPHFGTGSDGVSNLSDLWLPHADSAWMQLPSIEVANMWIVRNGLLGGFVMGGVEGDNYNDEAGGWFFHRTVDSSGAPTTEGYYALTFSNNNLAEAAGMYVPAVLPTGFTSAFVLPGVGWVSSGGTIRGYANTENYYDRSRDKWRGESHPVGGGHRGFHIPDYPSLSIDGPNAIHYPYIGNKFDGLDRPLTGLVAYHKAHHAVGDTFTLTRYGASRTFLATALRICHASYGTNKFDWRLAVLWE